MFRYLKKICFILLIMLLVGCSIKYDNKINTIVYNLNIGEVFNERIVFTLDSDSDKLDNTIGDYANESFTYQLFKTNDDFFPIANSEKYFYNKKINKGNNKLEGILEYEYLESEYDYSKFITECFENYDLITDKKYFEASISGEFYCWNDFDVDINVTSEYTIVDSNGENINNKYIWNINKDNYQDVDIYYRVYRNYNDQLKKHKSSFFSGKVFNNLKYIFGIIVVIVMFFVLFKLYKNGKNE